MAEFIPEYKWSDFLKAQKLGRLQELKNCEITFNGEYLFTFINGRTEATGYLRTQADYQGERANAVGGKRIEDIFEDEEAKERAKWEAEEAKRIKEVEVKAQKEATRLAKAKARKEAQEVKEKSKLEEIPEAVVA